MVILNLYGGPIKLELIQVAYGYCGQSSADYELTPEDYTVALRGMNAMLAQWRTNFAIDLGYNFPDYGAGSLTDESGILDPGDVETVQAGLAKRLAPTLGKSLSAECNSVWSENWPSLRSRFMPKAIRQMPSTTPRGQGGRWGLGYGGWGWDGAYYRPTIGPDGESLITDETI